MNQVFFVIGTVVSVVQLICGAIMFCSGRKLLKSDNAFKREKGRNAIVSAAECVALTACIGMLLLIFNLH